LERSAKEIAQAGLRRLAQRIVLVLYGDLKPQDIMIRFYGYVKTGDPRALR
jgi:hypothetical protein